LQSGEDIYAIVQHAGVEGVESQRSWEKNNDLTTPRGTESDRQWDDGNKVTHKLEDVVKPRQDSQFQVYE
jgi:hypothetical protein